MRFAANLPGVTELRLRDVADATASGCRRSSTTTPTWRRGASGLPARRLDGRPADDLLMVTLGTGIGGGIVLDGELYRGAHGMAGEIGHIVVQLDGEPCQCGQTRMLGALRVGHGARPHRPRGRVRRAAMTSSPAPAANDATALA